MTTVSVSPKFQVVIPKDIRRLLGIQAGQRIDVRIEQGCVVMRPELPVTALRGICPGINTDVPNDPESATWPGGCDSLPEPVWLPPADRA